MHSFRSICWLAVVLFGALLVTWADDTHPAFLDRPFPPDIALEPMSIPPADGKGGDVSTPILRVTNFHRGVELLALLAGKRSELAGGLGEWPHENDEQSLGCGFGVSKGEKIENLFQRLSFYLDLDWRYDSARDVIVLTPAWLRDDPRPGRELVRVLIHSPVIPWEKLPKGERNRVGGISSTLDPWRVAFDALVSKPENRASAGTLRLYHNFHGETSLMTFPIGVLYCGRLVDKQGRGRTLVLIDQERMTNKSGAGDMAFYIFDDDGRFLRGGVYKMAGNAEACLQKCSVSANGEASIDVGYGSFGLSPDHYLFEFADDDFFFTGMVSNKGKRMNPIEAQAVFPYGKMVNLDYEVQGGK